MRRAFVVGSFGGATSVVAAPRLSSAAARAGGARAPIAALRCRRRPPRPRPWQVKKITDADAVRQQHESTVEGHQLHRRQGVGASGRWRDSSSESGSGSGGSGSMSSSGITVLSFSPSLCVLRIVGKATSVCVSW